jgi:hypothetical protein
VSEDARRTERNHVKPPPPDPAPGAPEIVLWGEGTEILRIFDPTEGSNTELSFRLFGPILRFDHHRAPLENAAIDKERAIWYGAPLDQPEGMVTALEICMWESFAAERRVLPNRALGRVRVAAGQTLALLSLVDADAVRAGTIAQLAVTANPRDSQEWSRFFYDEPDIYTRIDGLLYRSAWIGGFNIALYERGQPKLESHPGLGSLPLDHPSLRGPIAEIACRHGWTLARARIA